MTRLLKKEYLYNMTEKIPTIEPEVEIPKRYLKAIENFSLNPKEAEYYLGLVRDLLNFVGEKTKEELIHPDNVKSYTKFLEKTKELLRFVNEKKITLIEVEAPARPGYNRNAESGEHLYFYKKNGEEYNIVNEEGEPPRGEYSKISLPINVGGKPFFRVENMNGKVCMIDEAGESIGEEYEAVEYIQNIGEKLFFSVKNENSDCVVIDQTGKPIESEEYVKITHPYDLGGKPFFKAQNKSGKWTILDETLKAVVGEYNFVKNLKDSDGKLLFDAENEDGRWCTFDETGRALYTQNIDETWRLIDDEGEPFGIEYPRISNPIEFEEKRYFTVGDADDFQQVVDEAGETVGFGYNRVGDVVKLDDKICFSVRETSSKWGVLTIGPSIIRLPEYEFIKKLLNIGGKLFLVVTNEFKEESLLNEKGEAIGGKYEKISGIIEIGGKPFFIAKKNVFASVIINDLGEEITEEFFSIDSFKHENGKTTVLGKKDGKLVKQQIFI